MLGISDVVWQALIAAVVTLILAILQMRNGNAIAKVAVVGEAVHTLVNSNMGIQLKMNAELSRWKADQTHNQTHAQAATLAEQMYRDHEQKQAMVDARSHQK